MFSEQGGSIGRADENDYVLPDTESMVSRTHALISCENGDYFLIDQSTNGTFVNGSPNRLEPGEAYRINDGDRLLMGNYLVVVSLVPANSPLDSASPLLQEMTQLPLQPDMTSGDSVDSVDEYSALPEMDGWPGEVKRPNWFPAGEENYSEVSSNPSSKEDSLRERPPTPALQQHLAQPMPDQSRETLPEIDKPEREQIKQRITGSRVPTGYIPGAVQFEESAGVELVPGGGAEQKDSFASESSEESRVTEQPESTEPHVDEHSGRVVAEPVGQPQPEPAPITTPSRVRVPMGQAAPLDSRATASEPALGQADTDLLAALLNGLGSSVFEVPPEKATEFVTQIGQLTQEAVQGMIDTLRLRDEFKREFYVPVTRIAPTDNNVFKHSANVGDALAQAFSEAAGTAYLSPVESTRQAFQDIAAHQLALVAGMQAAVTFLLERFAPKTLEQRIGKATVLDGVLPQIRKAHMWEQFEKEYTKIAQQAEEDFQRVFGQHFERAYTEHIRQLRSAGFGEREDPKS